MTLTETAISAAFFLNEQTGWIGTTNPGTRKTTDGGKSFFDQVFLQFQEICFLKIH